LSNLVLMARKNQTSATPCITKLCPQYLVLMAESILCANRVSSGPRAFPRRFAGSLVFHGQNPGRLLPCVNSHVRTRAQLVNFFTRQLAFGRKAHDRIKELPGEFSDLRIRFNLDGRPRACERLPAGTLLDGEIVAIDQNGRISFNLLQHHRSQAQALLFYAFDVLIHRGRSLLNVPLRERRKALSEVFKNMGKNAAPLRLSETMDATPIELVRVAKDFGFEGIVAKRADSFYESGKRSGAWVKYRVNKGQELVVSGYIPNNPLDSIIVGYYDGEKLIYVAKVRNGFVPHTRREVFEKLRGLKIPNCPFVNLPEKKRTLYSLTKEEMKKCVWLKPERVAQVEFAEWTPDGHLRHSKFLGLRDDKDPRTVTRD
jgi:ATP dependent DNA ligase C terminal region/ATP dependent DNA ligase domain